MKLLDLGHIVGPILLFGGPYSNLHATRALLQRAGALNIAAGNRICTGDVVAYGADPAATTALIRENCATVVAGNCERQIGADAADCGCGFDAGSACDLLSDGWYPYARAHVSAADKVWMSGLPDVAVFAAFGKRHAVIHGGATNVARFIWPDSDAQVFAEEIAHLRGLLGRVDVVISGHCGVAFTRQIGDCSWINAGVIGLPPHDGRAQTRYVVLTGDGARICRLEYDAVGAARAMRAAGLTQGYDASLLDGHWPSEDILPDTLRRNR